MRHINALFTTPLGHPVENGELLAAFEPHLARLPLAQAQLAELRSFVQYSLVGQRTRYMFTPNLEAAHDFASRAQLFQAGAEHALDILVGKMRPVFESAKIKFDAVLTTTSTGNLMPGISYRLARRVNDLLQPHVMLLDLGNVGCTGSMKALNLARALDGSFKNILIIAIELPSTLLDMTSARFDIWQGNCTFGDGAAALWVSNEIEPGNTALALEELHYQPQAETGLDLIRWDYRGYYTFALADETTFNRDVRDFVAQALSATAAGWRKEPLWAIHPAGISLLVRIGRKLGISQEALQPSLEHYRKYSNMSSASIVHILNDVAVAAPGRAAVNLLTMGAGFNVIYGRVRKER
jgi:predicted naringenin-chalcone synthase